MDNKEPGAFMPVDKLHHVQIEDKASKETKQYAIVWYEAHEQADNTIVVEYFKDPLDVLFRKRQIEFEKAKAGGAEKPDIRIFQEVDLKVSAR